MSYFISNDDLYSNYYLSDPFGFTCNSFNRVKRNSIAEIPKNHNPYNNDNNNNSRKNNNITNKNDETIKKNKKRRTSIDGFLHSFSFLNKNHDSSISTEDEYNKKQNQQKSLKPHTRTLSTPLNLDVANNSYINNINDKANRIELKNCGNRYSDLLLDSQSYQPTLEVDEKNTYYQIRVYLPDVRREEINLELCNNSIIICGERKRKINKYASFTKFNRTFNIPDDTNTDALKVNLKNDILELIFQKIKI